MGEQLSRTKRELDESRRLELRKFCTVYMEKWITSHPHMAEVSYASISPNTSFIGTYIPNPRVKTKAELDSLRKLEAIRQNDANFNSKHLNLSERVEEREKQLTHNSNPNNITKNLLGKKNEDISRLETKFSSRVIGVHGSELPKFSENLKDYWKIKDGYIEQPRIKSGNLSCKPVSDTYTSRPNSAKKDITLKPNQINPFPNFQVSDDVKDIEKRPASQPRFTQEFYIEKFSGLSQENFSCAAVERGKTGRLLRPRTGIAKNATTGKEKGDDSINYSNSVVENSVENKIRPRTAYTVKINSTEQGRVRSRGFVAESLGNSTYYL